jgi:hypothetical protein
LLIIGRKFSLEATLDGETDISAEEAYAFASGTVNIL